MTEPYVAPPGAETALIVDIDGTLALRGTDPGARLWYDWHRVGEDTVNQPVFELIQALHDAYTEEVIFVSGRKDVCRAETEQWLRQHLSLEGADPFPPLFMRGADDNRQDAIVKREIFDEHIRGKYDIKYVIDDRDQVVRMWRSLGLTVLQVADGAF